VGRLITLGTPHRGSELARLAHGACGVELRPSSEWIAGWRSVPALPIPCVSIYSLHDNLVVPQSSPELPGATWVAIPGVGHNAMHYSRPFHEAVAQALGPR
jgi:pimeloyl-ACP methyl ester carboxylesterase